jgi:hypothetical protein
VADVSIPNLKVYAYFSLPVTGVAFILDDPVAGLLDNVTYGLADDSTEIGNVSRSVTITRGRISQVFADINAGTANIQLDNRNRYYDPTYVSSPYYGQITPSKEMFITVDGITIFYGRVQDWDYSYNVDGDSVATAKLIDGLGTLGAEEFNSWTSTPQVSGARITAILDRPEVAWPSGSRQVAAGVSTLQADNVSWGSNVLNYAQLVARSELGYLFVDRNGVLTFLDRYAGFNMAATLAFDDQNVGIPFAGIDTSFGSELLFNRIGIDVIGGIKQTATDYWSGATYGVKSQTLTGLLMDSDAQALDMANYLVGVYANPVFRIATLTINLLGLTLAQRTQVLMLDITSLVSVSWTPNWVGSALSETCIVQGIEHQISPSSHTVVLHLGSADLTSIFTLDDDIYGLLDSNFLGF